MAAKIQFVGAGSGAPDLITVRGARLLEEADVIVYAGSLVNPALLNYAKDGCETYNSAKMTLDEVIDVMSAASKAGKRVVRLHTGDPSIYGAIREQFDRLDSLGIEYETCPGVSSFVAAAAAIKKEYTLPNVSQSVIITRMAGKTPVPEKESIAAFASHLSTMVVFLSAGMLHDLSRELIRGGYAADTPAAIVYKVSWPDEKIIYTTVSNLGTAGDENGISKTALVLVGNFLGSEYELSRLYAPDFSTEFREAIKESKL